MFRKTIITVLTVAVVATSAFSVTTTSASARNNNNRNAIIAGAAAGVTAAILVAGHRGYRDHRRRDHYRGDGRRHRRGDRRDYRYRRHCFEKPITRWSNYYDGYIVVGYRRVCR